MPLLRIETNVSLDAANAEALVAQASQAVARELGKPERYVMVTVRPDTPMLMAGTAEPAAFLDLRSIGLPDSKTEALSQAFCQLIEDEIGVPPDRVYINFADVPRAHWGWNGGTF
jgi:phenylpyruvate tautomerase PptA (4-oxalocrotonate tautomerase family)